MVERKLSERWVVTLRAKGLRWTPRYVVTANTAADAIVAAGKRFRAKRKPGQLITSARARRLVGGDWVKVKPTINQ